MSEDEVDRMEQGQMKIDELVASADKVTLRLISSQDYEKLTPEQQQTYKRKLDRKIKVYDTIRRFTGLNLYNTEINVALKKAKKVRTMLESDLSIYEKELNGRTFRGNRSQNHFYDDLLKKLPDSVKNDPQLEDLMDYIGNNANTSAGKKGLKGVKLELAKKVRIQGDIDDLLQAQVAEYAGKLKQIKDEIDGLNKQLAADPQNKAYVEARMEKNALFNSYIEEKTKLEEAQDRVLDQFLEAKGDYDMACKDIDLKEATVYRTKDTLRSLDRGIKTLEKHSRGRSEIVRVGQTMMLVNDAQKIGKTIGLASGLGEMVTIGALEQTKNAVDNYDQFSNSSADQMAQINLETKADKRRLVDEQKEAMSGSMYSIN